MGVLSSVAQAAGNVLGGVASGLFNANQAKKNRAFQERMYNKQVEDNIKFWNMQNEYALPSAELQRIKDAGLNPLLYYSGQSSAGQQVQTAQTHGGSSASMNMSNPFSGFTAGLAQMELLDAQKQALYAERDLKESQSEKTKSETFGQDIQNEINSLTKQIQVAMKYRDYDMLNQSIENMRQEMFNQKELTLQNVLTLMQGREFQIKHYELSKYQIGESILQGWKQIEIGQQNASAALKQASASWLHAVNEMRLVPGQLAQLSANANYMAWQMKREKGLFKYDVRNKQLENVNQVFDMLTKGMNINKTQAEILKVQIETMKSGLGYDGILGGIISPLVMPLNFSVHGKTYNKLSKQF